MTLERRRRPPPGRARPARRDPPADGDLAGDAVRRARRPLAAARGLRRPAGGLGRRRDVRLLPRPVRRHRAAADARRDLAGAHRGRLRRRSRARAARPRARPRRRWRWARRPPCWRSRSASRCCSSCSASRRRCRCCCCARILITIVLNTLLALPVYALTRRVLAPLPARRPAPPAAARVHDRRAEPALEGLSRLPPSLEERRPPITPQLAVRVAVLGGLRVRAVRDRLLPPVVPAGALRRGLRQPGAREPRAQDPHRGAARRHRRPQRHDARQDRAAAVVQIVPTAAARGRAAGRRGLPQGGALALRARAPRAAASRCATSSAACASPSAPRTARAPRPQAPGARRRRGRAGADPAAAAAQATELRRTFRRLGRVLDDLARARSTGA